MIDGRELRLLVTLAEELHFGRAASRLGIAQSSLSTQLQRLEDVVGAPLFNRGKRAAVSLTDVGTALLPEAREAIDHLDKAERVGRLAARGEAGTLEVGYIFSAVMNGKLPALLDVVRRAAPAITPRPQLLETPQQIGAVAGRKLDVGLCRPRPAYPSGVKARIVHEEPLGVLVPKNHRLTTVADVSPPDLVDEIFLLPHFNDRHGLLAKYERLADAGSFTSSPIRTRDFVSAAGMAIAGYGIVYGPRSLSSLASAELIYVRLERFKDSIATAMIWNAAAPRYIQTLADRISDLAR